MCPEKKSSDQKTFNINISGGNIGNFVGSGQIRYNEDSKTTKEALNLETDNQADLNSKKIKILFLAANPADTSRIRLGEEVRKIREGLKQSTNRDKFIFEERLATRAYDLKNALLEVKPRIVHFSGHGAGAKGLAFEDNDGNSKIIPTSAISGLFKLFSDHIECVVLNACYSQIQAKAISEHISYVIGMKSATDDSAAIEFSVDFYRALGNGESIRFAYDFCQRTLALTDSSSKINPVLTTNLSE